MKYFLFISTILTAFQSFSKVDCPSNYPNGSTLTYSNGAMNYPSGSTFRYSNGAMNYPSGSTLRYSNGSLNNVNGSTNTTGSVSFTTQFGNSRMRILVRAKSANFQTTLPFGNGLLFVEFDEEGNVICTVEGDGNPTHF